MLLGQLSQLHQYHLNGHTLQNDPLTIGKQKNTGQKQEPACVSAESL